MRGTPTSSCFSDPRKTSIIDGESTRSTPHSIARIERGVPSPPRVGGAGGGSLKNIRKGGRGVPFTKEGGVPPLSDSLGEMTFSDVSYTGS